MGKEVVEEVKQQLWLAGPLIAVSLLQYCLQVISVMFVGHLGELPLSGASMATSFAGVTGFSLLLGMASTLDTFCGQAFGAKQHRMVGVHTQRAMVVLTIVSVPLAAIWFFTGPILTAVGQDPEIAAVAGSYARHMIPSLFAFGLCQCLVKFLQNQGVVFPMLFCSAATACCHLLVCWGLVFGLGLGVNGAAVANSISYWMNALLLGTYVLVSPGCRKTWTGFSRDALHDLVGFLKLAIPSSVMVCLEFWSFELLVLLSGLLANPKLETSVLSICLNTATAAFMIPFGLGAAASTRVSNELGAGYPRAARLAVCVVVVLALIEGLLLGSVMIIVRDVWGYAYSNEEEVAKYVSIMMPLLALSTIMDAMQCVLSGTCRGCGWQRTGAVINLGAYYIVGVPCAVLLAFVFHIGGKGLWLGIICGVAVQVLLLSVVTLLTNWEKEAEEARDRVYDFIPVTTVS